MNEAHVAQKVRAHSKTCCRDASDRRSALPDPDRLTESAPWYKKPDRSAADTDWERIVLLYDALMQISPSPIVALNRAVAVGMAQGSAAGLDALDAIDKLGADSALAGYHLLPTVRGDLLMKLGRFAEVREEIQRAITMTQNLREQELLTERLKQIEKAASSA
jgi:RNA polymerase sigma-70 factor (ECF subfamily)